MSTSSGFTFVCTGGDSRSDQLSVLLGKSLVCLGLLFSDDCVDAQNRAVDRGGVSVLLSVLGVVLAMCSTTYNSQGIGGSAGGELTSALKALRLKQSALICKWTCWCLFVSTSIAFIYCVNLFSRRWRFVLFIYLQLRT